MEQQQGKRRTSSGLGFCFIAALFSCLILLPLVNGAGMFNTHGNSPFSHSEGFTNFHLVNLRFVSFWS